MGGRPYLIDTHVLIWLTGVGGPQSPHEPLLAGPEADLVVSAISAFEVSLKLRLGKLESARELAGRWHESIRQMGARMLDVTHDHGLAAGRLPWNHRDPFDRLLVAQAQVEAMTLVTADRVLRDAPGIDILAW